MAHTPRESFAAALSTLDEPSLAAFVAALYRARGWHVEVDGRLVSMARGGETRRLLVVASGGRGLGRLRRRLGRPVLSPSAADRDGVDTVVAVDGVAVGRRAAALDAALLDADDLYDLLLYGLDRSEASAVVETHLGDAAASVLPDDGPAPDGVDGSTPDGVGGLDPPTGERVDDDRPRGWTVPWLSAPAARDAVVVTLATVVVLAVVLGSAGVPFRPDDDEVPVVDPVTRTATGGALGESAGGGAPAMAGTPGLGVPRESMLLVAPGVTNDRVTSPEALAGAHASAVGSRPYVWRLSYTERRNGTVVASADRRTVTASPGRYVSNLSRRGSFATAPGRLVVGEAYADGRTRFVRFDVGGEVLYRREPVADTVAVGHNANLAANLLTRYLAANRTAVVDTREAGGVVLYRVVAEGSPDPRVRNYSAGALLSPDGVVHSLHVSYRLPAGNRSVVVTSDYTFDDVPPVTAPTWLPAARNATRGRTT